MRNQFREPMRIGEVMMMLVLPLAISLTLWPMADGQFLQHQSHLGRLVQSIASPLVLSSSSAGIYGGNEDSAPEISSAHSHNPDPSSYYSGANQHQMRGGLSDEGASAPSGQPSRQFYDNHHQQQQQHSGLQQSPSQQRGIPQHYYGGGGHRAHQGDQGSAPSNSRNTQEYRMGAYLGPTMDDKEMNGAFNSNDERDDDDLPAGYDNGPSSSPGGRAKSASGTSLNGYEPNDYSPAAGYGPMANPSAGGGYEEGESPAAGAHSHRSSASPASGYDGEDGADEDDEQPGQTSGRRGAHPRGGLNRAASQYSQQRGVSSGGPNSAMLAAAAAANGQVPFGYSGPVDLTGLLGVGGNPNSGYQVYNGDGSYPGQNYYDQQRGGGRNQAASMSNGYSNNNDNYNGYAPNGQSNRQNSNSYDNDDHENDADED